jgi:hypothetical protein
VELGSGNYKSQSTTVPVNGAYILAEDQNGVGAQFGASRNYFDYNNGKNTIATTSENFVTAQGYFSAAEQGSLVSQQLTGVCNSSNGCTGSLGVQTSINSYKLYPSSWGDIVTSGVNVANGKFMTASSRTDASMRVSTTTPAEYWVRAVNETYNNEAEYFRASDGYWADGSVAASHGFRPAGVLNLDDAQCLLAANISLRKLFKLENADK